MRALEAKKFLVDQTAEQAALENVPLSDLEKRMMYITETGECPEDPITLNDAFEAEYDTKTYEKKISRLMAHAYSRIKRGNSDKLRLWNNDFSILAKATITSSYFGDETRLERLLECGDHMFLSLSLPPASTYLRSSFSATGTA